MVKSKFFYVVVGYGSVGRYHCNLISSRYSKLAIVDFNHNARERARIDHPTSLVTSSLKELESFGWNWSYSVAIIASWGPAHEIGFNELVEYGVRRILCEKPLANSVIAGARMVELAESKDVTLAVHHHSRYSGFQESMRSMSAKHELGEPYSMLVHGGAQGIVTNGIHWLARAFDMFDARPDTVVSSVRGEPINPRSDQLMFYGGTATWSFEGGRDLSISLSNRSSVSLSAVIYYRDAVVHTNPDSDVKIFRRDMKAAEEYAAVTRTGPASEEIFSGKLPSATPITTRTTAILEEIESETIGRSSPGYALALLGAVIGAVASGEMGEAVSLPVKTNSLVGLKEWPIS
tara:strand:+ start:7309 stop:8352 length:1044 start_codon:yes stop_codon:yes gene_type:complete